MATTAQTVIDRAVQRSALNNPDIVPVAQLLQYITVFERAAYLRSGRMNPDYFGKDTVTATRASATDVWDLAATPGDVAVLTRAEVSAIAGTAPQCGSVNIAVGDRVNLILQRMPEVDLCPRAFIRGRKISSYKTELGTGVNFVSVLKVFYSPIPAAVTVTTQSVTLPDEWTSLLELPLSRILAVRDRRLDELPPIDEEYKFMLGLFDEAVLAFDHGVRRPLSLAQAIPLPPPAR